MVVWHWSPGCMLIFFAKRSTIFVDNKIKEVEQRNHCLALISSLHVDFLCCHQFGCQWFSVNQLPVKKCEPGIKLWFEKASAISSPWPPCQPPYHFHVMPPRPCPSPPTPHCQPPRRLPCLSCAPACSPSPPQHNLRPCILRNVKCVNDIYPQFSIEICSQ